jgi:hypothetical protein
MPIDRWRRQSWEIGSRVKVGFLELTVKGFRRTPGNHLPDEYLLERGGKFYVFVPHNGLHRLTDEERAKFERGEQLFDRHV